MRFSSHSRSINASGRRAAMKVVLREIGRQGSLSLDEVTTAVKEDLGAEFHLIGGSRYLQEWLGDCVPIYLRSDGRLDFCRGRRSSP